MKIIRPLNIRRKLLPYDKRQIISPISLENITIPLFSGLIPEKITPILSAAKDKNIIIGFYLTAEEMDLAGGTTGWLPQPWVESVLSSMSSTNFTAPVILHLQGVKLIKAKDIERVQNLLEFSIRGGLTSFEVILEPKLKDKWEKILSSLYCAEGLGWYVHSPNEIVEMPFKFYRSELYCLISSLLNTKEDILPKILREQLLSSPLIENYEIELTSLCENIMGT